MRNLLGKVPDRFQAAMTAAVYLIFDRPSREIAARQLQTLGARLVRKGGAPLEQIQITLGHQSLETTQKYLGTDLDCAQAACDYIGLSFSGK